MNISGVGVEQMRASQFNKKRKADQISGEEESKVEDQSRNGTRKKRKLNSDVEGT